MLSMERAGEIAAAMELPDWVVAKAASLTYACFGGFAESFEATVETRFPEVYKVVAEWVAAHKHPFAARLPLMNPWYGIAAILGYFAVIVGFRLVSRFMGKFSCRSLGLVHNLGLHLLSLYMSVGLMVSARAAGYSLWNNAAGTSPAEWRIAKLIWLFYVSKVMEWMDTIIMLLKQNYHQVSFLHVYHHTTIFMLWWLASLAAPGGEAYYSAMVNSAVHVAMYGYYFLTLLFPSGPVRHVLNKFKFVITKGQMTQFAFNCLQSAYDLVWVPRAQLKYGKTLLQLLFWYMISLLVLFGNFLAKNSSQSPRDHHLHGRHMLGVETGTPTTKEGKDFVTPDESGIKNGMPKAQAKEQETLSKRKVSGAVLKKKRNGNSSSSSVDPKDGIRQNGAKPLNVDPIFHHA